MKKSSKIIFILIGFIVCVLLFAQTIGRVLFKEMYCSNKVAHMRQTASMVPAIEDDVKQVPNLHLHVGQLIGWEFSQELACERGW